MKKLNIALLSATVALISGCSNKMCYEYQKYVVIYHNDDLPVVAEEYRKEITASTKLTADQIEKMAYAHNNDKDKKPAFKDGRVTVTRYYYDSKKDKDGKKRCSHYIDVYEVLVQDNVQHDLGNAYFNTDSAGASFRERGWEHTLNSAPIKKSNDYIWNLYNPRKVKPAQTVKINPQSSSGTTIAGTRTSGDLSVYDLLHWNHYCNSGRNMTQADFIYISNHGEQDLPVTISSCSKPDFTYQDYLSAWTSFCKKQDLTQAQKHIVSITKQPKSGVSCPRIK